METVIPNKWWLRWRFDYADGRHVCGMWSNPGDGFHNSARLTDKNGMIKASIEAKNIEDQGVKTMVFCEANEYVEHQWIGATSLKKGPLQIHGMTLVSKDTMADVFIDGRVMIKKRGE